VMLTHGWRRYKWNDMLAAKMPVINYPPDNYLSIYGQLSKAAMQKITKEEFINLIVRAKDSTKNFYVVQPDSSGLLKQPGLVFYDTAKVLYSFNKNKLLNPQIAFSRSNYTYNQRSTINNYKDYLLPDTAGIKFNQAASQFGYYIKDNAIQQFNKEKTLQAVLVKSGGWHNWKNDPMLKMDEKYTDFAFRGGANSISVDVLHDEMAPAKMNVINYMIGKAAGLRIKYPSRGALPFLMDARGAAVLYINERQVELEEVHRLDMASIAYIKYIPMYAGLAGLPPVVAIYLKKGDDLIDNRPKDTDLQSVRIPGYSPLKEFYSPDYSQSNTTGTDARTTLLWQPYILMDANNKKVLINFYNNDFSKN